VSPRALPLAGRQLIDIAARAAFDKKAEDAVLLELSATSGVADWFLICQGDNPIHNRAIADAILDALEENHTRPWHVEGREQGRWILLDYTDVVVHVMLPDLRAYYQLESLWEACPRFNLAE
jgi:ribosome-associated protein